MDRIEEIVVSRTIVIERVKTLQRSIWNEHRLLFNELQGNESSLHDGYREERGGLLRMEYCSMSWIVDGCSSANKTGSIRKASPCERTRSIVLTKLNSKWNTACNANQFGPIVRSSRRGLSRLGSIYIYISNRGSWTADSIVRAGRKRRVRFSC